MNYQARSATQLRFRLLGLAAMVSLMGSMTAGAADVRISATQIIASNDNKPSDPALKNIVPKLRNFPYKSYQRYGSGSAKASVPGKARIDLGNGINLKLKIEDAGEGKLRIKSTWTRGKKGLLSTTIVRKRGEEIILGGPKHKDGVLIIIITVQ